MPVKIRLTRIGAKKRPFYRVVVADSEAPRDGRFIEILGTYDPKKEPSEFTVDKDKLDHWIGKGAIPTETVAQLCKGRGLM
jgi:small subunit ribosomal protein S16